MPRNRSASLAQLDLIERLAGDVGHPSALLDPTTDAPPVDEQAWERARLATPGDTGTAGFLGCPRLGATARLSPESAHAVIRELRWQRVQQERDQRRTVKAGQLVARLYGSPW